MAAVRDPATDAAPPPAIQGEARSSLPADPSRATAALYRRHGATVYRYAWHMLGSREDAEDATQATFLSVHTALTSSTPVREPQAWVLKIARNECLARIAAGMRRPLTASLDDDRVGRGVRAGSVGAADGRAALRSAGGPRRARPAARGRSARPTCCGSGSASPRPRSPSRSAPRCRPSTRC